MNKNFQQFSLPFIEEQTVPSPFFEAKNISNGNNSVLREDRAFHEWYRFVLSFPPHLVRDYFCDFGLNSETIVLDPFSGTGTTVLEAKLNRIPAVGLEANPFPYFASTVKTCWNIVPDELLDRAIEIANRTYIELENQGINDRALTTHAPIKLRSLTIDAMRTMIKDSVSPLPLHKTLVLLDQIQTTYNMPFHKYFILALGKALVSAIGNLRFGPEVGVGTIKQDVPVVASWLQEVRRMSSDLQIIHDKEDYPKTHIHHADSREVSRVIAPKSIHAVITSPPYPNEKDYTRTTRLESVVLGFVEDMAQLRTFKKSLLRSNTRGVYKTDNDDAWVANVDEIQQLAEKIEARRIELGKTSGFEKLYARVTKLYFGGMARHFHELTNVLKPGAKLAYVVGDQASYLQVLIRTGQLLATIAEREGYIVERLDLFRTRFATATQSELREEVLVLRWPG
jgi:DNA modification methylase